MSKEAARFAAIIKGWGPTLQRTITKANSNRWPSGSPGGKGGQYAPYSSSKVGFQPKQMSLFNYAPKAPQLDAGKPAQSDYGVFGKPMGSWGSWDKPEAPKAPPPGAKPHPQANDKGQSVTINYPTKPSAPDTWKNPDATATFAPGSATPASLNGVAMKPWANAPQRLHEWANVEGQRPELDQDFPLDPVPGKSMGAGVIIQEPDGRIWLTKPTNSFGGYQQTFPKGTVENGLSLQASAIKEAYEETGLKVQITGVLGDYERTTSVARFYIARRVGGTPADMGWESQALRLATSRDLGKLLNMPVDKGILDDLREEQFIKRAPLSLIRDHEVIDLEVQRRGLEWLYKAGKTTGGKGGSWQHQERWPGGTPLGGQWKAMGADGLTLPPTIAGGLTGSNSAYQKKANAMHTMAQAGNHNGLFDAAIILEKKVQADAAAGKKSTHVKWNAQLSQYTNQLVKDVLVKPKAEATAEKLTGPEKLSSLTYAGPKPGGSNPGAVYTDKDGQKWLVKGNKQIGDNGKLNASPPYSLKDSEDRAKNEVLASKLMAAAGIPAPEIKLVDLEGKHDGSNLGVAVKWVDGLNSFNSNSPGHLSHIQSQYAVHAWLGNYDVLGMGYDNTSIKDGYAINVDPGGALLFRAQGLKKAGLDKVASEWETMRSTTSEQKAVFGKMTDSQLKESAKQLANVSDDTINKLVDVYGPGDLKAKAELAATLRARRDNIMLKAGLTVNMKMGPSLAQAEPAPAPEPPKIADAVPAPANTPVPKSLEKPTFNLGLPSDGYYQGLAEKAEELHKAGDLAGLKALGLKKNGDAAWPTKTQNGKLIGGWHSALVSDLEMKQQQAAAQVSAGQATVTDAKGQEWKATDGVLNPVPKAASNGALVDKLVELHNKSLVSGSVTLSELEAIDNTSPMGQLLRAVKAGNIEAAKKAHISPVGEPSEGFLGVQAKIVAEMEGKQPAAPAASAPKPALPDFEAAKKPLTNTNAASHNPKVDVIAKLAKAGDVKGLLALNFGSNTYAGQQVQLANDALAALGSPHKVTKKQAANSHPALVNGTVQNAPVTAAVQPLKEPAPAAAKPAPTFKPELLSTPPHFAASAVPAVNAANNQAANEIFEAAKKGSLHAVQNLKFEQLDKATQQKTGVLLSYDQHPSKGVQAYYSTIQDEMNEQLTGKPSGPVPGSVRINTEWKALSDAVKPVAMGAAIKAVPDTQKIGLYIVLGKAPTIPSTPTVNTIMGGSSWAKWAVNKYKEASYKAKSTFSHYITTSGAREINTALRYGKMSGSLNNGMDKKEYVDLFNKELAIDIPEGAKFTRSMGTSGFGTSPLTSAQVNKLISDIENAGPGTVLQEPGFTSASHGGGIMSSNEIQWQFTAGQGVKAFPAWLTENKGEQECLFPPNTRYLVRGFKKQGGKFVVDALLLPSISE